MKRNLFNLFALLSFISVCFIFMGYQSRTSNDDYQSEKAVITEMNRCRMNPKDYAETTLKKHLKRFVNENTYSMANGALIMTNEGRRRVLDAINELKNMQPVGPLTYDDDLAKAARFHCEDTGPSGGRAGDLRRKISHRPQYGISEGGSPGYRRGLCK